MRADFPIVLDANVLAESAISDLFLRLSEEPRLVSPRWTEEIWEEARRTMVIRLGWPEETTDSRIAAARATFPEAMTAVEISTRWRANSAPLTPLYTRHLSSIMTASEAKPKSKPADSTAPKVHIPTKADTYSNNFRTPIPIESGQYCQDLIRKGAKGRPAIQRKNPQSGKPWLPTNPNGPTGVPVLATRLPNAS